MVLLLLLSLECIPPFSEDLADRPVVLIGMSLVNECAMTLAEDHESVHRSSDMITQYFLLLKVEKNHRFDQSAVSLTSSSKYLRHYLRRGIGRIS